MDMRKLPFGAEIKLDTKTNVICTCTCFAGC